ncbi:galactose-6-phosphate isomerase subunit LacA [uncultured Helcococcus sp.]|uniref:galactose-6-phosphate isomerase subunit LacA n=1 Tax=uncultured Helcococcus sp. TaxID=1072508 RepID=UPI0028891B0D|nr:galactose-6-phosphate isomerase subunit LacA [uncultured Helcococcus sp.]
MRIILGSDKNGFELKEYIKKYLSDNGYEIEDVSENASESFIDSTKAVAKIILEDNNTRGILFDGKGSGSFITACKIKGIVAAQVSEERSAYMTREHNNAKIITMGQDIVGKELARNIVKNFLEADYDGGRHQVRVDMLNAMC